LSRGADQKDCGSRPAWTKSYQEPISMNKLGLVAHACDPVTETGDSSVTDRVYNVTKTILGDTEVKIKKVY
jgi:hypothetical protein